MSRWVLALAVFATACQGDNISGQVVETKDPDIDKEGPVIQHEPVSEAQIFGEDVLLEATVSDAETGDSGVALVEVFYRQETSVEFKSKGFTEVGGGLYQGKIRGADIGSGGMRYFLKATDWSDNTTCLPEGCEEETWHFSVIPAS